MQPPPTPSPGPRRRSAPALVVVAVLAALLVLASAVWLVLRVPPSAETAGTGPAAPTTSQGVATASVVAPFELRPRGAPPVRVRLEVAATPAQRSLGLMHRTTLPEGTGMVFLFPEDREGGFWMKNTLVPLSIAFVRADGRVVAVREMVPCTADPCPVYRPGGRYRYAVELPAGAFADAGVGPGDRVVAVDPRALPAPS